MSRRACKILATLGPATSAPSMLERLLLVGADAVRLNFSHGDHDGHKKRLETVRAAAKRVDKPVAVLADLQGPKLRVGTLPKGGITLQFGAELEMIEAATSDDPNTIPVPHPELFAAFKPGDVLRFDDGNLGVTVTGVRGARATVKVDIPGTLTDKKGLNFPSRALDIPALTDKDRADLAFALELGVDYIALSFVQSPDDVREAQRLVKGRAGVVAKIEKPSAVDMIDDIVAQADAVMVARGDLGVELPLERVPVAQREIIRSARAAGKPVIVATHMLQSMVDAPAPTRAEASDVATAVYLGADAVMLSAETAVGRHPLTAVAVMDRVIGAVEADPLLWLELHNVPPDESFSSARACAAAASTLAERLAARAVVAFTESGATGRAVARARPRAPIVVATPHETTANAMALVWGARPLVIPASSSFEDVIAQARAAADALIPTPAGAPVVLVAGLPVGASGRTNVVHVLDEA